MSKRDSSESQKKRATGELPRLYPIIYSKCDRPRRIKEGEPNVPKMYWGKIYFCQEYPGGIYIDRNGIPQPGSRKTNRVAVDLDESDRFTSSDESYEPSETDEDNDKKEEDDENNEDKENENEKIAENDTKENDADVTEEDNNDANNNSHDIEVSPKTYVADEYSKPGVQKLDLLPDEIALRESWIEPKFIFAEPILDEVTEVPILNGVTQIPLLKTPERDIEIMPQPEFCD
jgi:hypothetical protein